MAKRGPYKEKDKDLPALAKCLKSTRVAKGWTLEEMAIKLKMSKSTICRIENGDRQKRCLNGYLLFQIAKKYEIPYDVVLKKANWPQILLIGANDDETQQLINGIKGIL